MNEQRGITVVAAIGIVLAVILAIKLISNALNQPKPGQLTEGTQEGLVPTEVHLAD